MTPSRRRPVVSYWHDAYRVSERRACRVARLAVSSFRYESVQEPRTALPLYRQIENACAVASTDSEIPAGQMLKPDWEDNGFVQKFFTRNTVGQKAAYGPLLIISSDADPVVSTGMTARVVARMCKERDMLQFRQYQNPAFAGVLGDSVRDQLTWIQARFAGRPASSNCH